MNTFVLCTIILTLAIIKKGDAIHCWDCTSNAHGRCADHFNTTLLPRTNLVYTAGIGIPRILNCDSDLGQSGYSRHVCLKMVEFDRKYNDRIYTRSCYTLNGNETVDTCPTRHTNNDRTVEFCEYCDTPECNGS